MSEIYEISMYNENPNFENNVLTFRENLELTYLWNSIFRIQQPIFMLFQFQLSQYF